MNEIGPKTCPRTMKMRIAMSWCACSQPPIWSRPCCQHVIWFDFLKESPVKNAWNGCGRIPVLERSDQVRICWKLRCENWDISKAEKDKWSYITYVTSCAAKNLQVSRLNFIFSGRKRLRHSNPFSRQIVEVLSAAKNRLKKKMEVASS